MRTLKSKLFMAGVAAVLAGSFLISQVYPSFAGRIQATGSTESFRFTVEEDDNGGVYVPVNIDIDSSSSVKKYADANLQRGKDLIAKGEKHEIPVQITFTRPMPVSDVRDLVQQTNLQVTSFLMVGYSSVSNQRGTRVQFSSLESEILEKEVIDAETGDALVFEGIMVLQGKIKATEKGLGQWLDNPDVFLVDTSEVEVRDLLARDYADVTAGKEIEISLPTPFWDLDW